MEEPDVETLRAMLQTWDPHLGEDTEPFAAALVMLAALRVGSSDLKQLSRPTGVRLGLVREFAQNLRGSGVWTPDGRTVADWDGDSGELAFWADVSVALGLASLRPVRRPAGRRKPC